MAVWSEVDLPELSPTMRLDAEYYQPAFLDNMRFLRHCCRFPVEHFGDALLSISGGATPLGADYPEDGVPFLRVQNIMQGFLNLDYVVHILPEVHLTQLKRSQLQPNDVLLTITGVSYGKAAFVPPNLGPSNINQHSVRMQFKKHLHPEYVAMFLNCRFGKLQSDMKITGVTRPALDYGEINTFLIPILPDELQLEVVKLCEESQRQRTRSLEIYAEAETLLLDALGLNNLDPTHAIAYERNFREVARAGRFDAQYFQPKYTELMSALDKASQYPGWSVETIGELSAPLKYGTSSPLEYISSGIPFLRIADVVKDDFDKKSLKHISAEQAIAEKGAIVRTDDVIVSRSGTLGLTIAISNELDGAIFGSYFIRTRPNTNKVHPLYLSLFMNALPGRLQVQRNNTGGVQTNLTIPAIESIRVAFPSRNEQKTILQKVWDSRQAAQDAQSLLESAKRRVEELIEEGA